MERVKVKMDEMSLTRYIPFEVFDGERVYQGSIVEMITCVGGISTQDVEVVWKNGESPDDVTDDEVIEAYEKELSLHAHLR